MNVKTRCWSARIGTSCCAMLCLPRFEKDCPLTLKRCQISIHVPPLSILQKSKREYRYVKFGDRYSWFDPIAFSASIELLQKVEHVDFDLHRDDFGLTSNLLQELPNLKSLATVSLAYALEALSIPSHVKQIHLKKFRNSMHKEVLEEWQRRSVTLTVDEIFIEASCSSDFEPFLKISESLQRLFTHCGSTNIIKVKRKNLLQLDEIGLDVVNEFAIDRIGSEGLSRFVGCSVVDTTLFDNR